MKTVILTAVVGDDHRLTIEVPADVPAGPVELTIRPLPASGEMTREEARARLAAGGALSTFRYAPPDAVPLSREELEEIGRAFVGPRPISELIDEDRGPH